MLSSNPTLLLNHHHTMTSPKIPLARPKERKREPKTLVDLIAERQPNLQGAASATGTGSDTPVEFLTIDPSNPPPLEKEKENEPETEDNDLPPIIDTLLLSFPLSTLHLTLSYLAAHQYAQDILLKPLLRESALVAFPVLSLLIHLAHGHLISFSFRRRPRSESRPRTSPSLFPLTRNKLSPRYIWALLFPPSLHTCLFLGLAIFLGTKLVSVSNTAPYYAVMKRAPAVGTLWVWCVLEVPVGAAVLGAVVPLGWGVWMGYGIF